MIFQVMAVGMGGGVNKSELRRITKGHAYTASTFKELVSDKFIRRLKPGTHMWRKRRKWRRSVSQTP